MPPSIKDKKPFSLEQEIEKVKNFIENQNNNQEPLKWTKVSHDNSYDYNWNRLTLKPLKNWYNDIYRPQLFKNYNSQNLSPNSNLSDIENPSTESITLSRNDSQNDLKQLLVLTFAKIETQVRTFSNPALKNYYNNFFHISHLK